MGLMLRRDTLKVITAAGLWAAASAAGAGCPPPILWERAYAGPAGSYDEARGVAVDVSANVVVAGYSQGEVLIRKYSSAGGLIWSIPRVSPSASGSSAYAIAVDASGNIIVAGEDAVADTAAGASILVLKYDPAGTLLWARTPNGAGSGYDIARAAAAGPGGRIAIAGIVNYQMPGLGDWMVSVYDSDGTLLWRDVYDSPASNEEAARGVVFDASGNVIAVGYEERPDVGQPRQMLIRKYSPSGSVLWSQTSHGGAADDESGCGVAVDHDGNLVVASYLVQAGPTGLPFMEIRRYSPGGSLLASKEFMAAPGERPAGVAVDPYGNVAFALPRRVAKLDPALNEIWNRFDSFFDTLGIATDGSGRVIVAGNTEPLTIDKDWLIRMYEAFGPPDCYRSMHESQETTPFPNPVTGDRVIIGLPSLRADAEEVTVEVFTASFQWAFRGVWRDVRTIQKAVAITGISRWAPGFYTVRASAKLAGGQTQTWKEAVMVVKR